MPERGRIQPYIKNTRKVNKAKSPSHVQLQPLSPVFLPLAAMGNDDRGPGPCGLVLRVQSGQHRVLSRVSWIFLVLVELSWPSNLTDNRFVYTNNPNETEAQQYWFDRRPFSWTQPVSLS